MIQDFAEALRKKLREDMNYHADVMAAGGCADFHAYQKLCGVIHGLATAEAYLIELAKKAAEEDDA